jgi:very-short-patch-repair endonuclease
MTTKDSTPRLLLAERRGRRRAEVDKIAAEQEGVVSRRQLYALGYTRGEVRANVRAQRWRRLGRQSICVHRGPLTQSARHWAAVFEGGPRAYFDAGSALVAAGLEHYSVDVIRVSVPRGARVCRGKGIDIRQTRRWREEDLAPGLLRRAKVEVAAVHEALWARSERQAGLVLFMVVQQGLSTADRLGAAMIYVRRDKRRDYIHGVIFEMLGGVRTLGELDVVRECRRRGLPEPDKQVLRKAKNGTYYLDFFWKAYRLVVEVDGIQHEWVQQIVGDALRQNDVSLEGNTVLRLPLLGLRVAADEFFEQIETALVNAGCEIPGRRTA